MMAVMLFLSGCNKAKQFTVTLNIDNADQLNVYLCKDVDGQIVQIDETVFNGNTAVLKADFDNPQTAYVIQFDPAERCGAFSFFTENQNTTITGDKEAIQDWRVKGCATMDAYNTYRQELMPMEESIYALFDESQEAYLLDDTVKAAELYAQVEAALEEYQNYRLEYYKNHLDNYLFHYMLYNEKDEFDFAQVKEVAESITTESIYSKRINDYLEEHAKVEVGARFIDFTLQTVDGKDVNLGTVINNNRLVMVDFWASWCGPCRGENPYVKAAYEKYHASGLQIIGVSVDSDEGAWLKAVADDGMTWIQVRDVDNIAASDYLVQYIPSNFLYDADGIMIAKGLRGEALEAKLAELLQ